MKFLEKKAKDAEREIAEKGTLSEEHAIPLLLKSQFNHITHLDSELTAFREQVDRRFEQVDERFERIDQRFDKVDLRFEQIDQKIDRMLHGVFAGFALISTLMTIFHFAR